MNGLLWILLLCCCGKNNGCGGSNNCVSTTEYRRDCGHESEEPTCSLKDKEKVWSPYMGNGSEHDNDCGCEHKY